MKRLFLLSAALVVAAGSFAQLAAPKAHNMGERMTAPRTKVQQTLPKMNVQMQRAAAPAVKAQRRDRASGVYYNPTGGLYLGFGVDGSGSPYTVYEHAPYTPTLYQGTNPQGVWHVNGQDTGVTGATIEGSGAPNNWYYMPTFVVATDSFNVGFNNVFGNRSTTSGWEKYSVCRDGMLGSDSICAMYVADDHATQWYNDVAYSNEQIWGYLDSDNMFGTGKVLAEDSTEVDVTSYGIFQEFQPLATPLYAENLLIKGVSARENPILEGDTLRAILYTVEDIDGDTSEVFFDTLYCTVDDVEPFVLEKMGATRRISIQAAWHSPRR